MGHVRLKLVPGKELELEGEAEDVKELLTKLYADYVVNSAGGQRVDNQLSAVGGYALRSKATTEVEWILVYALGAGKADFTREDLLGAYRLSRRYSENRRKNLSFNLKSAIKRGWINVTGANTFSLSPEGREKAEKLVGV